SLFKLDQLFAVPHPLVRRVRPVGAFGTQFVTAAQFRQSLAELAFLLEGTSQVAMKLGLIWIEGDGSSEFDAGHFELPLFLQGHAEVGVRWGVFWIALDGFLKAIDGGVPVFLIG